MRQSFLSLLIFTSALFFLPSATLEAANRNQKVSVKKKPKREQCRDKRDNDHDGLVDYPADPGCSKKRDKREKDPAPKFNSGVLGIGADLQGRRPFPADNPWNTDISQEPVDPNSDNLIASIGNDIGLHPDFGTVWQGSIIGIPYIVVSGDQKKSKVTFDYAEESDPGPYPIPGNPAVEGGSNSAGDRHILMIDRDNWKLYELFYAFLKNGKWHAGSGAIFDLNSNELRPEKWTSADAAGLPIFPGLVRYDETVILGEIKHALRFTVSRSRRAYVHPARHYASSLTSSNLPPMGMRVRLKANYDISRFSPNVRVILSALKKYGMFVADNGANWFISGSPDARWDDSELSALRQVKGSAFEVVQMPEIVTN